MDNSHLLDALREGLPLSSRPFEAIGRSCGASEDEVLERLRRLHGNGTLAGFAPLPPRRACTGADPAPGDFDARLLEIVGTGFPLLPHPYEAIAAILGATEADVLERLRILVDTGRIGPIGTLPRKIAPAPGGD
ncbi:MAG: AsnC family protein [Burkholderiaceae bacterium]